MSKLNPHTIASDLERLFDLMNTAQHDNHCEIYHRARQKRDPSSRWQCTCWKHPSMDLVEQMRDEVLLGKEFEIGRRKRATG